MKKLTTAHNKTWRSKVLTVLIALPALASADINEEIIFHNEATDTIKINKILDEGMSAAGNKNGSARVIYFAEGFIDSPYSAGTLEHSPEALVVNIDEFDCTTLIENALALAYTIGEGRTSWRDFTYNLQRFRYRNGIVNGFASRLNYISDFVIDNSHRGNLREITSQLPGSEYTVKSLDFMTRNRDSYPALADSIQYARMREIENGYRNHRYPYIKSSRTSSKALWQELKDGDIVCITTKKPGLDVQHVGVIKKVNGVPYLLHASSAAKKVVIDKLPLHEYMRKNLQASGIRILRLAE